MSKKYQSFKKYPGVRAYFSNRRTVNGRPDLIFYIRYRDASGKLIEEKVGRLSEGYSAALAAQIRAERLQAIRHGEEIKPLQQRRKEAMTLAQFVEERYLPHVKENKTSKTYKRETEFWRLYISPVIGDKTFKDVSPFDLERIKADMTKQGKAPRTIEYCLAVVRQIFNRAREWGLYDGDNPATKVKAPRYDNRRIRFLTPEEAKALLDECRKRSQTLYEICLLSLHTGMRFGEIAKLTWGDLDLVQGLIHVKDPKNATNRVCFMTAEVKVMFKAKAKALGNRIEPSALIFPDKKGKPMKRISRSFYEAVKALGLNDGIVDPRQRVCFHSLRHTFASWLVMQGTPIYTVKELVGHKTLAMTERYAHLAAEAQRQAVKGLEGLLKEATQKEAHIAQVVQLRPKAEG